MCVHTFLEAVATTVTDPSLCGWRDYSGRKGGRAGVKRGEEVAYGNEGDVLSRNFESSTK